MGFRTFILSLMVVFISVPLRIYAQAEDYIWAFSRYCALDFNSGVPEFIEGFQTFADESGSAAISDQHGNLLFYTDGRKVWDKEHVLMPNGDSLLGNFYGSASQGTVICQYPDSDSLYYIFTANPVESPGITYLRYHLVDMSQNGGLGDVVAAQKNIIMDSMVSEKLVFAKDKGCGYWLISFNIGSPSYHAFNITSAGIEPAPAISYVPEMTIAAHDTYKVSWGELKVSPDGTRIAHPRNDLSKIELGTFNPESGIVTDILMISIDTLDRIMGCEFSPDSKLLYGFGSRSGESRFIQYNLSGYPSAASIESSAYIPSYYMAIYDGASRLAPDGKIYLPNLMTNKIDVIHSPNTAGSGCGFEAGVLVPPLGPSRIWGGLGTRTLSPYKWNQSSHDHLNFCIGDTPVINAPAGYANYLWNNGYTGTDLDITTSGSYWVTYWNDAGCIKNIDSFTITFEDCPSGIQRHDTQKEKYYFYPNPLSSGYLHLERAQAKNSTVVIYDINGTIVFHTRIRDKKVVLDLSELGKGNYFLSIDNLKGKPLVIF